MLIFTFFACLLQQNRRLGVCEEIVTADQICYVLDITIIILPEHKSSWDTLNVQHIG